MTDSESQRYQELERARRHVLAGDYVDALEILDALLAQCSSDTDAITLRGNVLDLMGDAPLARAAYDKVLQHDPGNIRALIDLAELDEDAGRPEAALLRLDLALTLLENGQAYVNQAQEFEEVLWAKYRCTSALGRPVEAKRILEKAVRMCPASALLRGLLANS